MKRFFWIGVPGLAALEIALVYFIMPMPGSQRMRSIDLAFALDAWRWPLRGFFGLLALIGVLPAWRSAGRVRFLVPVSLLVSYCTVCRTGRVFRPTVNGSPETFRLVGMDHFNAMFEDQTTGSWWRQANGEAIIGPMKGTAMPELPSVQVSLKQWIKLHPQTLVMQADQAFTDEYAKDYAYERGTKPGGLTGTDTASWHDKSWVVGVAQRGAAKAYDWKRLCREHVINDTVGGVPIVLALGPDGVSYFAFQRPDASTTFALRGDSLVTTHVAYALNGKGPTGTLAPINASQEFWHSWRTFQPNTAQY